MKKKEAIITVMVITLALIGGIVFYVIFTGQQKEAPVITAVGAETTENTTIITTAGTENTTIITTEGTENTTSFTTEITDSTTTFTTEVTEGEEYITTSAPVTTTSEITTKTVVQEIFPEETKPEAPIEPPVTSTSMVSEDEPPVVVTTTTPKSSEPKMGDTSDGYIWIDGFGWIVNEGGGVDYQIVGSDGDINKIVGIM